MAALDADAAYNDAVDEIQRRQELTEQSDPPIDVDAYLWRYEPGPDRTWHPQNSAAPAWSLDVWRDDVLAGGTRPEDLDQVEASLWDGPLGPPSAAYLSKNPAARGELRRLESKRDARLAAVYDLDDQLAALEHAELSAYGDALKTHIEESMTALELTVPVQIRVDLDSAPATSPSRAEHAESVDQLVNAAVGATRRPRTYRELRSTASALRQRSEFDVGGLDLVLH